MPYLLQVYYKLLGIVLNIAVKSRSIPLDPSKELGLDIASPVIYILPCNSTVDLLILRAQCIKNNLPDPLDPLVISGEKLPRYLFISNNLEFCTNYVSKNTLAKLFYKYINLHKKNKDLNIKIILVLSMFGRFPGYKQHRINSQSFIFKSIKRISTIIYLGRDNFIYFSASISLRWIISKYGTEKNIIQKFTRLARMYFTRQCLVATGPCLPVRQDLFNKILASKAIIHAIEDETSSKKISNDKAQQNIIKLMKEITANLSYNTIRLTDRILHLIWHRIYQGINVNQIERIRKLAYYGYEIVYVPCHRSHMDYLLLSYILYHHGIVLPHIVAGINLNFWPTGFILRRLGAFFIRRNFKSNKLYSTVFHEYLNELFNRGHSIEYFIEGGRSRTGFLLYPKTGMLSMTVKAVLHGKTRPIMLVPVYIGYDHIIEANTYIKELQGAIKKTENLLQMLCSFSKLRKFGYSYINFGEPLSIIAWLNQHVPNWRESTNSLEVERPFWFTSTVNNIAIDLMTRINNAVAVNAMNLSCTALLASRRYIFTREQLIEQLNCYLNLIRNVPYSLELTIPFINANMIIDHVLKINKFKIKKIDTNDMIILSHEQTFLLTYYRNNIIHVFVIPSLIATIIIKNCNISLQEILYRINILYPILKAELFLRWNHDELAKEVNKLTNELLRQQLILIKNNKLQANPLRSHMLQLLAASIQEILQRYAITFWLLSANQYFNRIKLANESQILAQKLSVLYETNVTEFFDKTIFNTLLITLRSEGYIHNTGYVELKKITKVYQILAELIVSDVRLIIENNTI